MLLAPRLLLLAVACRPSRLRPRRRLRTTSSTTGPSTPSKGPGGKTLVVGFSQIAPKAPAPRKPFGPIGGQEAGVDLRYSDAQQKQENQIRASTRSSRRAWTRSSSPVVETGWEVVLKKAKEAEIPVILVDRGVSAGGPVHDAHRLRFRRRGADGGQLAGPEDQRQCVIAELAAPPAAPATDRKRGFQEAISTYLGMKIVMSQTGNFERAGGKQVMEAFLKSPQGKEIGRSTPTTTTWRSAPSVRSRKRA